MTPMEKKIAADGRFLFPSKVSSPELFEGNERERFNDEARRLRAILLQEKGNNATSRTARLEARTALALLQHEADMAGIYVGQDAPTNAAFRDKGAITDSFMQMGMRAHIEADRRRIALSRPTL